MVIKSKKVIEDIYFPLTINREKIIPQAKVLDVGCAFGYFLGCCDKYGFETFGIEVSKSAIEKASKETNAKLFKYDVDSGLNLFENNCFDLVTAFDLIEHLDSPYKFLKECHRILKIGGKVVITTPNLGALARLLVRNEWHGFKDKTHKYLFTTKSIEYLFKVAGFKIVRLETPFQPLPKFIKPYLNKIGLGGQIWIVGEK